MRRTADHDRELAWLLNQPGADPVTGCDLAGWDESVWVLHAMYEDPRVGDAGTYDDLRMLRVATDERDMIGAISLDSVATATGIPLGMVSAPGPGWSRLAWVDYLSRSGRSLGDSHRVPPCFRWFPTSSFPLSIQPPPEGSLDLETFGALIDVVASLEPRGAETQCYAFMADLPLGRDHADPRRLWRGALGALPTLVDPHAEGQQFTPTNWWPTDRSWFVMTDYDLMATKISGSGRLIESIRNDTFLETVAWAES